MRCWPLLIALTGVLVGGDATAAPSTLTRLDGSTITIVEVERFITERMKAAKVTGLAIAVLQGGEIAYVRAFGERDAARHLPLEVDTVMYGASFTKAIFGAMVAALAEEQVLDLDRPIAEILARPWSAIPKYADLARDPRANRITARMLLTHTAGFANYRFLEPGNRLRIHFEPGSRYAYSGEGYNLLQLVVEQVTGRSVGALMRERVFEPLGMTRTSMTWQPQLADNTAVGHDRRGRVLGHVQRPAPRAAGSMDTTIVDAARLLSAMMRGTLVSADAKQAVLAPRITIRTAAQFPTLVMTPTQANDRVGLAYGLGWGLLTKTPYGPGYFKEGHDDGWGHYMLAFDRAGIGIVLMSNSDNGEAVYRAILETVMRNDVTPWAWEGYP
jgi:CubicO group peptidase (beta-lactamase class C family)